DNEWSESDKVLVEVSASINEVRDENNQPIQTKVAEVEVDNYYSDSEKIDYQNYKASYMQNLKNSDYFKWLFKHYLWWISLIAFVIVGFITFSFYIAWLAETASTIKTKKVKK
ncbi:MAG: hypothetical protein PHV87_00355, partial [Bacilli bacterium]|nr:hypothetical protein [Bacilli bacterium]